MPCALAVLNEMREDEWWIAVTVPRSHKIGADIHLASSREESAQFAYAFYSDCRIEADQERLLHHVNVLLAVQLPPLPVIRALRPGAVLLFFIHGATVPDRVRTVGNGRISAFAMKQVPGISGIEAVDAPSTPTPSADYSAVLLGEAGVPFDVIFDMEEIHASFTATDVSLVSGANDVVNPAACTDNSSRIFGMPILNVDHAHQVYVTKRGQGQGCAGIENLLFYADSCNIVHGDAQPVLSQIVQAIKELGN
jgi:NAD/NADP transhydrogenase alpha subunit